ncbi:MAG TPA: helix-turn-helix domain-containing protein [Candidatus Lambdaproteobacteria bacterium]|nr:helix-turn-helix domain-containing protein [Candidatus Lambdaproteobacteria bacterium]
MSPRRLGSGHKDEVAVSNWLSGRNEPTLRNLLRLSTALRTDPAELLTDDLGSTSS